jgi:response regulator RpfG family c-di-GMP phosphodiesterase
MLGEKEYDLVLLDINMPDLNGTEVCRLLRENPPCPNLKIIMSSGGSNGDVMAQMLLSGADDFITKPFSVVQLQSRVKAALRFKAAQDRSDTLNRHLLSVNQELTGSQSLHEVQAQTRSALVLGLTKLVEHRSNESTGHLERMRRYCRSLAEEAARMSPYASEITPQFIDLLEGCAPLHDIGNVGLPDHILLKPGKFDAEERAQMQAHTVIGASTLADLSEAHGGSLGFLQIATDIVRHHHERWDGAGYPDRLAGEDIPLAARIVAIADVYDALRTRRAYKAGLAHAAALQVMLDPGAGRFDPTLLQVLQRVAPQFERIFHEAPDR